MDHICMTLPVLPGKTSDARSFLRELGGAKRAEFDASERRLGISKELWYLAASPFGEQLILYMEMADFGQAMTTMVGSREPFDVWCKDQLRQVTGIDFDNPPADMKPLELLCSYEAAAVAIG
jgi:hypothetical protein